MMKSVVGNLSGEYATILEKAIDGYGLPWDAPVELHIADEGRSRGIPQTIEKRREDKLLNCLQSKKRI